MNTIVKTNWIQCKTLEQLQYQSNTEQFKEFKQSQCTILSTIQNRMRDRKQDEYSTTSERLTSKSHTWTYFASTL